MNADLLNALNRHLVLEFNAFHQYMAMSVWFELNDLPGFAKWMRDQSAEEMMHAHKIVDHLLERDQAPVLPAIDQPKTEWASAIELVEEVLASEKKVTAAISELCDLADSTHDRPAQILLQWFVSEQVEEENMVVSLLGRLRLVGGSGVGLLMVDQELGSGKVAGAMEEPAAE